MDFLWLVGILAVVLALVSLGYWLGWRECEVTYEGRVERLEQMLDADPRPVRKPGQPTNINAGESRVTLARRREGRWSAGPHKP